MNATMPHTEPPAIFSEDRRYRYVLTRRWGPGPALLFLQLNPSEADEHRSDATVRRDMGFARGFGYNAFTGINLYAFRAKDPRQLPLEPDLIGPHNDYYIDRMVGEHDLIVLAWGANAYPGRARTVASRIWRQCSRSGATVAVFGWTDNDQPKHPLRLRADTPLRCLTAGAHPDYAGVDPRWERLIADTAGVDEGLRVSTGGQIIVTATSLIAALDQSTGESLAGGPAGTPHSGARSPRPSRGVVSR